MAYCTIIALFVVLNSERRISFTKNCVYFLSCHVFIPKHSEMRLYIPNVVKSTSWERRRPRDIMMRLPNSRLSFIPGFWASRYNKLLKGFVGGNFEWNFYTFITPNQEQLQPAAQRFCAAL
jgi:hypothetical protein